METRDRLIDGMQDLLWERGYVGTSPQAILERAGAGKGSLYHHFTGKADLASAALQRSAEQLQVNAEAHFSGPGTATERITKWLRRERDVLRGCPVGRLAQDPDVIANPELRRPVDHALDWLQRRLTQVLYDGQANGEFAAELDTADVAAAVVAVLQGGYVLSRAAGSVEPFQRATSGVLALLATQTAAAPAVQQ